MSGFPIYTSIQYLKYLTRAKGAHGVHSPFVYNLISKLIPSSKRFRIQEIEEYKKSLLNNHQLIDVIDFKNNHSHRRTISSIAKNSLSTTKFSAFLHLLVNHIKAKVVLETGTSLGVTTQYLSQTNAERVVTMEASSILIELAKKEMSRKENNKIDIEFGDINNTFPSTLIKHNPDFVFLDADHRGSTIEKQVNQILEFSNQIKCIVIHDIYWSADMTKTWNQLVSDTRFSLTIDIFQAGLLFFNEGIEKQHFTLRF